MFDFFNYVGELFHGIKALVTGDVNFTDVSNGYFFMARRYISTAVTNFISSSRSDFSNEGRKIFNSFDVDNSLSFFTDNFVYWVVGIIIGFFVLKFIIQAIVDLISRLIDIT